MRMKSKHLWRNLSTLDAKEIKASRIRVCDKEFDCKPAVNHDLVLPEPTHVRAHIPNLAKRLKERLLIRHATER